LLAPAARVLLGIRSSISRDAAILLRGAHPTPRALNTENIPADSPFLLAINHYDHPRLGAWWSAALLATTIASRRAREPRDLHFMMAREWWYPSGFGKWVKQPLTNWAFGQIAKAYGTIRLPPVLGNDEFRGEGATAVRYALSLIRRASPELIAVAPEGKTGDGLALCAPPTGAGLFVMLLTHDQLPILPCGLYEDDDGVLTANFGAPFQMSVARRLPKAERDREAAREVMTRIGRLLPERMWGMYCEEIRKITYGRSVERPYASS
jgi:hypothetical protein